MNDTVGLNIESQMTLIISKCETVTEKVEKLREYKAQVLEQINEKILEVKDGYTYCPNCNQWYKNKTWEVKTKQEYPENFTNATLFKDRTVISKLECPVGHLLPYKRWGYA